MKGKRKREKWYYNHPLEKRSGVKNQFGKLRGGFVNGVGPQIGNGFFIVIV
jgi:hypothetical protein